MRRTQFTKPKGLQTSYSSAFHSEILGFHLTDSQLKYRKPKITVSGTIIPEDNVDAQFDRMKVQLPAELRMKLRLENTACEPIKTFAVKIEVFYTDYPWLSRFSSIFDSVAHFGGQASPGSLYTRSPPSSAELKLP
jgi:hypothetical protein